MRLVQRVKVACSECGAALYLQPADYDPSRPWFCSHGCFDQARSRNVGEKRGSGRSAAQTAAIEKARAARMARLHSRRAAKP